MPELYFISALNERVLTISALVNAVSPSSAPCLTSVCCPVYSRHVGGAADSGQVSAAREDNAPHITALQEP